MTITDPTFTPTQRKILAVLSDGQPHHRDELIPHLWDGGEGAEPALRMMISRMRKVLRPTGQDIICEYVGRTYKYRHVRLLSSPYSGVK